jgi:hypothetical protein
MSTLRSREWRDRARSAGAKHWKPELLPRAAIHAVFGVPFLCSLAFAIRPSWWRSKNFFRGEIGSNPALLWPTVAALGMLWVGVLSLLTPAPWRRYAGAFLVIAGSALLVAFHP